jgi:hypothetical protein
LGGGGGGAVWESDSAQPSGKGGDGCVILYYTEGY